MRGAIAGAALILVAVAAGVGAARAQDGLGDGFQSVGLVAVSGGLRVIADTVAGQPPGTAQAGIPEAEASLTSSTAHALASIAWPSALAGNAGALLALLGPQPCTPALPNLFPGQPQLPPQCSPVEIPAEVMAQYKYLNSPLRAEALSPIKPTDDTSVPGGTMTARATSNESAADAILGGFLASELVRFGTTRANSVVRLAGVTTAVADARSYVSDITVATALTIGSVTSVVHAETDGEKATSTGATTVQDASVAGVPVSIDASGVHVSDQVAAVIGPLVEAVNQAVAEAGIKAFVTRPTQTIKDGATTFDAGSLIIDVFPPGAPGGVTLEFGAAHITASATLPFQLEDVPVELPPVAGVEGLPDLSGVGSSSSVPPLNASGAGPELALEPASAPRALPAGINGWWVFFGLAVAAIVAGGLRRLPDRVLDGAAAQCEVGEAGEEA